MQSFPDPVVFGTWRSLCRVMPGEGGSPAGERAAVRFVDGVAVPLGPNREKRVPAALAANGGTELEQIPSPPRVTYSEPPPPSKQPSPGIAEPLPFDLSNLIPPLPMRSILTRLRESFLGTRFGALLTTQSVLVCAIMCPMSSILIRKG